MCLSVQLSSLAYMTSPEAVNAALGSYRAEPKIKPLPLNREEPLVQLECLFWAPTAASWAV